MLHLAKFIGHPNTTVAENCTINTEGLLHRIKTVTLQSKSFPDGPLISTFVPFQLLMSPTPFAPSNVQRQRQQDKDKQAPAILHVAVEQNARISVSTSSVKQSTLIKGFFSHLRSWSTSIKNRQNPSISQNKKGIGS